MRRKICIVALCIVASLFAACTEARAPSETQDLKEFSRLAAGYESITSQELTDAITYLASAGSEGRRSGTEGNAKAGEYIAKTLAEAPLPPIRTSYFQSFNFEDVRRPDISLEKIEKWSKDSHWTISHSGRNIIAVLEGTSKKNEYVVIGAHYDHLGIQGGKLFPGADDNASGTAAVMEIAEAFAVLAEQSIRPQRSIVFTLFDAEEWGLCSEYFVENSPVPLEKIAAYINLDMVGRNKTSYLEVYGSPDIDDFSKRSPELSRALERANKVLQFQLNLPAEEGKKEQIFSRSDQASFFFARQEGNRIPVVFLTSGLHENYHEPSDTADKINYLKLRNTARLAFLTVWIIADQEETPVFHEK